jgi:hypothetical protein
MTIRDLARAFAEQLRSYMREKTPHNNIIAIPMMHLFGWASVSKKIPEGVTFTPKLFEEVAQTLKDAGLCQIVMQQTRQGGVELQIQMTQECREFTDDQITARLFPERS